MNRASRFCGAQGPKTQARLTRANLRLPTCTTTVPASSFKPLSLTTAPSMRTPPCSIMRMPSLFDATRPADFNTLAKPSGAPLGLANVLKSAGLVASNSEGMRMIEQGGVRIDGAVVSDKGLKLEAGTVVVQVGKRKFARVSLA